MMFTRVAPLRLKFSPMGSRTLVARTISSLTRFKALPTSVSLSPRLYTSAVSMKLIPLSRATLTIRVVSSWPRLPMFILPPNCIVPSANSLTMSPVFPSFLYLISHTPFRYVRRLAIRSVNSPQRPYFDTLPVPRTQGWNCESGQDVVGHDPFQNIYLEGFRHQLSDALFQVLKVRSRYVLIERSLTFPFFVEIKPPARIRLVEFIQFTSRFGTRGS